MDKIQWIDAPEWSQLVTLDKKTYCLRARYNTTSRQWSIDVLTSNYIPIVTGIAVVQGIWLLEQYKDERLPRGDFFVSEGSTDYQGMLSDTYLVYVPEAEL